eukprot:jgi/Ulvmu1/8384/UM042_0091.1
MTGLKMILPAALALAAVSKAEITGEPGTVVGAATIGEMGETFTVPQSEFPAGTSSCSTIMAGCTGTFVNGAAHQVEGVITVIDDCTFEISGWQFDGIGPAVEWWAAMQNDREDLFPYPANAQKIGELGAPGNYQTGSNHGGDSEIVVRLGTEADGSQILLSPTLNHISLWCEDFSVDFGNAALECPTAAAPVTTPTTATDPAGDEAEPATPTAPADDETAQPEEASGASTAAAASLLAVAAAAAIAATAI